MKVMKIADKMFVGKGPLRVAVFRRDDQKIYNMVYRDGKSGRLYAKKFKVGGVTRDKEYNLFKPHSRSRVFFFVVHDTDKTNSRVFVHIDPSLKRVKQKVIDFDFGWIDLQGRSVKGTTLTAHKVARVVNAPKSDDAPEKASPKDKASASDAEPKKKEASVPKRQTKPAEGDSANRVAKAEASKSAKKRGRPSKPEPKGQAKLDI